MLTVLLATKNRARILAEVLEAFCHLKPPAAGWKLVVVDNGSLDRTAETIASFLKRLPLHTVTESKPGKNCALNTGLSFIEGDLVVLTDDDVFPAVDWLVQLRKAADTHEEHSIFGGSIVPRWQVSPPPWIEWIDLGPVFTITDPALRDGGLVAAMLSVVQGPNMAIRSDIFRSGIRFDDAIGPKGCQYPMGSETELVLRLSQQGHKAWFVKEAVVEHFVREEQLHHAWILQRAIRLGRGRFRMSPKVKTWNGIPLHLCRDMPKEALCIAIAWLCFQPASLFRARLRLNVLYGKAIEARIIAGDETLRSGSTIDLNLSDER